MPANTPYALRFRPAGGAAGSPPALLTAELAWNQSDNWVYGGFGDDGSGNATSIVPVAKAGVNDNSYVPAGGAALQVLRKNAANTGTEWATPSSAPTYTAGAGIGIDGGNVVSVNFGVVAAVASPTFTGAPLAPTPATADNSTKIATTAFVQARVTEILGGAAAAYDTFVEIQALMQADDTETAGIITSLATKLVKTANLSDLADVGVARGNLGLGSMAIQAANAVNITGGTISGVTLRGGTF